METQTWRQRHLSTVTAELEDLVVNLQQPGSCCQACGGYQSLDQITVDVIEWTLNKVELYFAELEAELRATELISPLRKNIDQAKVSSIISNAYIAHWRSQGLL